MDNMDRAVQLAERVVLLRAQLSQAEGDLRGLLGGAKLKRAPRQVKPARPAGPAVSQRVRDLLHDGRRALTFGEVVELVGGASSRMAARSALKKLREKQLVRFAGGKYSWTGK